MTASFLKHIGIIFGRYIIKCIAQNAHETIFLHLMVLLGKKSMQHYLNNNFPSQFLTIIWPINVDVSFSLKKIVDTKIVTQKKHNRYIHHYSIVGFYMHPHTHYTIENWVQFWSMENDLGIHYTILFGRFSLLHNMGHFPIWKKTLNS